MGRPGAGARASPAAPAEDPPHARSPESGPGRLAARLTMVAVIGSRTNVTNEMLAGRWGRLGIPAQVRPAGVARICLDVGDVALGRRDIAPTRRPWGISGTRSVSTNHRRGGFGRRLDGGLLLC